MYKNFKSGIIIFFFLHLFAGNIWSQPPDQPLRPEEWIQKMGNGNWLIFHIPPDEFGFADVSFSPELLDSLKAAGYTGGRLHWQARDLVDPQTHLINADALAYMSNIMDELVARDMAVCFQYDCLQKDEPDSMNAVAKSKYFTSWDQLCDAFKDKSHLIAMCPVIEFHGWEYLRDLFTETREEIYREQYHDSTNWFYNECTKIFREYNPTRIMSYKPWGAAKKLEFETLNFPFEGNHPDPDSGYYVASGSGSYGMGEWWDYGTWSEYTVEDLKRQTITAGLDKSEFGVHHGVQWRSETGIQFWIDHWEPAFWKTPGKWTDEQNLAYTQFFLDTLQALGIASSGPQTRRIWDNDKGRFFQDPFTQEFLGISAADCWRGALVYPALDTTREDTIDYTSVRYKPVPDFTIYPNPARDVIHLKWSPGEKDEQTTVRIIDLSGKMYFRDELNGSIMHIDISSFRSGIYLLIAESHSISYMEKITVIK